MLAGRPGTAISRTIFGSSLCLALMLAAGAGMHSAPWTVPRTAWGDPDFQGVTWDFSTMTPLNGPPALNNRALHRGGSGRFEPSTLARRKRTIPMVRIGGTRLLTWRRRTSLIVDPPNGRIPPLTPEAQKRAAALAQARERGEARSKLSGRMCGASSGRAPARRCSRSSSTTTFSSSRRANMSRS